MNVTREVISDLWPVYTSGEAGADTRALVEEFLREDPEFAKLLQGRGEEGLLRLAVPRLPPDRESASPAEDETAVARQGLAAVAGLHLQRLGLRPYRFGYLVGRLAGDLHSHGHDCRGLLGRLLHAARLGAQECVPE